MMSMCIPYRIKTTLWDKLLPSDQLLLFCNSAVFEAVHSSEHYVMTLRSMIFSEGMWVPYLVLQEKYDPSCQCD